MKKSTVALEERTVPAEDKSRYRLSHARDFSAGFFIKLILVMVVNAVGILGIVSAAAVQSWGIVAFMVVALVVVDWVYFSKRMLPAKYLVPGLIFLFVYQIFAMAYTGYVAFTNYGTSHMLTQDQAVSRILEYNERQLPDSPVYPMTVLERDGEIYLGIVEGGVALIGSAEDPLEVYDDAVIEPVSETSARIASVPDFRALGFQDLIGLDQDVSQIRVAWSDDPTEGSLRTDYGANGFRNLSVLKFDEASNTLTNSETGDVYTANDHGSFVAPDGTELTPGWRVAVGFENFTKMVTDSKLAGPFSQTLIWTFAFGVVSVLSTFALGLFLAIVFNSPLVRGRKIYRSLLILPYAFPGFLSALIWAGMLNRSYGFINEQVFGGAMIPWLSDPMLAKFSILAVNLWLGFPYMFLITTGALQSIPSDINEAARIDGAGPIRVFRSMTLPLLLVSVTPLLIASFAFNFNNFSLIYMLTGGGPGIVGNQYGLGSTDILISMVYKIAIEGGGAKDYGLASAMSIVIFLIVGLVSWLGFRRTRSLEEIN